MCIISLTYIVDLNEVDQYLEEHLAYLEEQYQQGHFIASGRKVPRTGGIILSNVKEHADLVDVISKDPFYQHEVAEYEITEFVPSKTSEELSFLISNS